MTCITKVQEDENGDMIIEIPPEFGYQEGDTFDVRVEGDTIILSLVNGESK